MSTNNVGFYEDLTKIIIQLSSNMHLISSSVIPSESHLLEYILHMSWNILVY